jgi:hypothetical protein
VRLGGFALCVAACGRFDFDAHGQPDAAPPDAGAPDATAADFVAALACETDVSIGDVPLIDELQWVDLGGTQVVFAIHHLDATHHELHAHVLSVNQGQIVKVDDVTTYTAPDLVGLAVARLPVGLGVVIDDYSADAVHAIRLDAAYHAAQNTMLAPLTGEYKPYAHASSAQMIVGTTSSNSVAGFLVDDSLAPISATLSLDGTPDLPTGASIAADGAGFIVGWRSDTSGECNFERVDASGVVTAGPLGVTTPTSCSRPSAIVVGGTAILAMHDGSPSTAMTAVANAGFTSTTVPAAIGATDSEVEQLVADGTRAIAVVRTTGDSRIVAIATDGSTQMLGSDFGLSGSDSDHETGALVAGALLHARSEGGQLRIRKLCR